MISIELFSFSLKFTIWFHRIISTLVISVELFETLKPCLKDDRSSMRVNKVSYDQIDNFYIIWCI